MPDNTVPRPDILAAIPAADDADVATAFAKLVRQRKGQRCFSRAADGEVPDDDDRKRNRMCAQDADPIE